MSSRPVDGQKAAPAGAIVVQARQIYAQRCALCHGAGGRGDGVAAVNLSPRPRSLQDVAWQRATSDAQIAAIIVKGGAGVGKSVMMPASPDLGARPEAIAALVAVVRELGRRGEAP